VDKEEILALLRSKTEAVESGPRREAISRLAAALSAPASFDELEWELPPMARRLGPGVWMDAIKNGGAKT
jgi:hypothetical protein